MNHPDERPEKTTQRTAYMPPADSGNNSNPIKNAQVTADLTYWIYTGGGGENYTSHTIQIPLREDLDHSGLYNGTFYFYGGQPGVGSGCGGCHSVHGADANVGHFRGTIQQQ